MNSIWLKAKELLTYYCGWHGNLVNKAAKNVADADHPKEIMKGIDISMILCYQSLCLDSQYQANRVQRFMSFK